MVVRRISAFSIYGYDLKHTLLCNLKTIQSTIFNPRQKRCVQQRPIHRYQLHFCISIVSGVMKHFWKKVLKKGEAYFEGREEVGGGSSTEFVPRLCMWQSQKSSYKLTLSTKHTELTNRQMNKDTMYGLQWPKHEHYLTSWAGYICESKDAGAGITINSIGTCCTIQTWIGCTLIGVWNTNTRF